MNPPPTPNVITSLPKASEVISKSNVGQASRLSTENNKILSRDEALKQIRLARQRLAAITPVIQWREDGKRRKEKKDDGTKRINCQS